MSTAIKAVSGDNFLFRHCQIWLKVSIDHLSLLHLQPCKLAALILVFDCHCLKSEQKATLDRNSMSKSHDIALNSPTQARSKRLVNGEAPLLKCSGGYTAIRRKASIRSAALLGVPHRRASKVDFLDASPNP